MINSKLSHTVLCDNTIFLREGGNSGHSAWLRAPTA
jgi:hypothetical protein